MMHHENASSTPAVADHPIGGDRAEFIAEISKSIVSMGLDPAEYDLPAIDAHLERPDYVWNDSLVWFNTVREYWIPGRTQISCPEFCTRPAGHLFEDGEARTHESADLAPKLDCEEQPVLSIEQHERRHNKNDAAMRREDPVIYFSFSGDEMTAADARKIAAALTSAAERLEAVSEAVR